MRFVWGKAMNEDYEWNEIRKPDSNRMADARSGAMRIALLFGGLFCALAIFATPFLKDSAAGDSYFARSGGVDRIATGSVRRPAGNTYTVRKSVLQPSRESKCIIRTNGIQTGDC